MAACHTALVVGLFCFCFIENLKWWKVQVPQGRKTISPWRLLTCCQLITEWPAGCCSKTHFLYSRQVPLKSRGSHFKSTICPIFPRFQPSVGFFLFFSCINGLNVGTWSLVLFCLVAFDCKTRRYRSRPGPKKKTLPLPQTPEEMYRLTCRYYCDLCDLFRSIWLTLLH